MNQRFVIRKPVVMSLFCDIVTLKLFCENVTMRKEQYHMTQKELQRIHVVQQCINGILTNGEAAHVLGLSQRQVIRLKKGVRNEGPQSMIHHNRGRQPAHTIPQKVKDQIIHLKSTIYQPANFTHFTELLAEREQILLSRLNRVSDSFSGWDQKPQDSSSENHSPSPGPERSHGSIGSD